MLIQFSVENYRSIREKQTFSLVASADKHRRDTHVSASSAPATPDLLRSAIVYGANAAGKSNLLRALAVMVQLVRGTAGASRQPRLPYEPFLLDEESATSGTWFEVAFVQDGVRYQFGVRYNAERILYEALYAYPEGRPQRWYSRAYNASGEDEYEYGGMLRGQKKVWQEATRPNALFLTTAVSLNSDQLQSVFSWFDTKVRPIHPFARIGSDYTVSSSQENAERKRRVLEFLGQADLGIGDFVVKTTPFDVSTIPEDAPDHIRQFVRHAMTDKMLQEVSFLHRTRSGFEAFLDLEEESGGTKKLFELAGPWVDTLENGYLLLIDELDTSLHPVMLQYLVKMFHDPEINLRGAQLVFTTHDTNVMGFFRRDQMWLMDKDAELSSALVPLSDFSPRKNENMEKGYLEGRFGGLPFVGSPVFSFKG
ncbi:ATP-binding protein [Stenotrophomonas sp.]|uniref:AAA family ATPase n=1 Tax=Stenotrophomonas sp. TaxID=69392 RepID=UPI0028ABDC58|nr:ATP-binding protein [Stenotrophomonas sp.]